MLAKDNLLTEEDAKKFYEDRYSRGYMEDWPVEKKQRVLEIVKNLNLPDCGDALDFGCGNGVFTEVIKEALPKWVVYGCDISDKAISNASSRVPGCVFFANDDKDYSDKKFDFIFTHHVLEHVVDIKTVAAQINERGKTNVSMLHICPCGNPGSYEHKLCQLRIDGVNTEMENRFIFEDEGHVRRMTTEQCAKLFRQFNFNLKRDYYSNQYHGAINWITRESFCFIVNMFNPINGKNMKAKIELSGMMLRCLIIYALRKPVILHNQIQQRKDKKEKHTYFLSPFYLISKVSGYFDSYIESLDKNEWDRSKSQDNGSEMYLFFQRD